MFHQLMSACYLIQRDNLGDVNFLPSRRKRLISLDQERLDRRSGEGRT